MWAPRRRPCCLLPAGVPQCRGMRLVRRLARVCVPPSCGAARTVCQAVPSHTQRLCLAVHITHPCCITCVSSAPPPAGVSRKRLSEVLPRRESSRLRGIAADGSMIHAERQGEVGGWVGGWGHCCWCWVCLW